jgi:hypothetical protein
MPSGAGVVVRGRGAAALAPDALPKLHAATSTAALSAFGRGLLAATAGPRARRLASAVRRR